MSLRSGTPSNTIGPGCQLARARCTSLGWAEVQSTVLAARAFVDACMVAHLKGELDAARAALAKAWVSEQEGKVMDECLQLFGGYGYMLEYPIAELYVNARVQRIYGGTNEIMKEIIGRSLRP